MNTVPEPQPRYKEWRVRELYYVPVNHIHASVNKIDAFVNHIDESEIYITRPWIILRALESHSRAFQ